MDLKVGSGVGKDGKMYEYLYVDVKVNGNNVPVRLTCDYAVRPIVLECLKAEKK